MPYSNALWRLETNIVLELLTQLCIYVDVFGKKRVASIALPLAVVLPFLLQSGTLRLLILEQLRPA